MMRVSHVSICTALAVAFLSAAIAPQVAAAQDAPEPPKPPMFGQLFPNPTGQNGYEDWVQAGDLIQNNKLADEALDAPLTMKRRLLADPQVQTALHLLHTGMSKPTQPPRMDGEDDPLTPEYAVFRKMARLLNTELYVQFADGRVDAALDTLEDGLRFGYRMQTHSLISGTVGTVVSVVVLKKFSEHLDQLSEYQCLRIRRIVEEAVSWPSPATFLLRAEEQSQIRMLDARRADPTKLEEMFNSFRHEEDWDDDTRRIVTHLRGNPADMGVLVEQTKTRLSAYYDAAIANLKLPRKERKSLTPIGGDTLDGRMFVSLAAFAERSTRSFDRAEAMLRLMGVHAAIRAYKWEYNHLPLTLAELNVRGLALDPHTGNELRYQNNGATYDLFSSGPVSRGGDGKPDGGTPTPIRL